MFLLSKTLSYQFEMRSGIVRKEFFLGGGGYTSGAQYVYSLKQGRKSAYHVTFRRVQVLASRTV